MIEDIEDVINPLSKVQQRAINKLQDMKWKSAYDIQESRRTLDFF